MVDNIGILKDSLHVSQCNDNNLSPYVCKTKAIAIDFRKRSGGHAPVYINRDEVEVVDSFQFLGIQITNNLSWSLYTDIIIKEAH